MSVCALRVDREGWRVVPPAHVPAADPQYRTLQADHHTATRHMTDLTKRLQAESRRADDMMAFNRDAASAAIAEHSADLRQQVDDLLAAVESYQSSNAELQEKLATAAEAVAAKDASIEVCFVGYGCGAPRSLRALRLCQDRTMREARLEAHVEELRAEIDLLRAREWSPKSSLFQEMLSSNMKNRSPSGDRHSVGAKSAGLSGQEVGVSAPRPECPECLARKSSVEKCVNWLCRWLCRFVDVEDRHAPPTGPTL